MKFVARFVEWYYDEFDDTFANVYDVLVETGHPYDALEKARMILSELKKAHSSPGSSDFISLTDENGVIYVSSLSREGCWGVSLPLSSNSQLVVLPKDAHDKLPKSFCLNGESFFVVNEDMVPIMRFPKPR